MINKLKRKFILLATVSMFALMAVLVLVMNVINYSVVEKESDATNDVLLRSNELFAERNDRPSKNPDDAGKPVPPNMSPEVPYESRFFIVSVASDGSVTKSDFSKILSVDKDSSEEYVKKAFASQKSKGFIGRFRYEKRASGQETVIIFLDCGRKLDSFDAFLKTSIAVGTGGCVIAFAAFVLLAGKIVKPIAESYSKQKRFISDAGHEMKTPLTIINANVDLLEGETPSEELADIREQTERMTELTNNLVFLSRMEESERKIKKDGMSLTEAVIETANSFRAVAASKKTEITVDAASGVVICASPDAIRHLVSVLIDNAVKYAPTCGKIKISLSSNKKSAILSVFNTTETEIKKEDLKYVFDRFFRTDESRNSTTGGHGIGLSIAKAVVEAHGGSVIAETETGKDFRVTATLPLK